MIAFFIIAALTLTTAAVALSLRNLIHSALLLIASWAGIAAFYLWAGAQFVAFAQVLVYVGAVSMVVLFAVLLTRHSRDDLAVAPDSITRAAAGVITGGATLGVLVGAILSSRLPTATSSSRLETTVKTLGLELLGTHAPALLIIGGLLTVALLGALILASQDRTNSR